MTAISPEVFKSIRRIQIYTTRVVQDLMAGAYHSAFKGRGMEFEDVREYLPGDDDRSIDWNVTARMNHPYVKNHKEERELTVILVVDVSASSRFGSQRRFKSELVAEIGAVLAFSAIKNNDKVGLILFSDTVEKYIPPKKGVRHVLRVIRELLVFEPKSQGTDISKALKFLGKVQKKSGICFVISDFLSPDYSSAMAYIAKKHDLISVMITDPCEKKFPSLGMVTMVDLETGETATLDTSLSEMLDSFSKKSDERLLAHQKMIDRLGAGNITLQTDKPYVGALRSYLKKRKRR